MHHTFAKLFVLAIICTRFKTVGHNFTTITFILTKLGNVPHVCYMCDTFTDPKRCM